MNTSFVFETPAGQVTVEAESLEVAAMLILDKVGITFRSATLVQPVPHLRLVGGTNA